jgi:hypothetical protein
MPEIEYCGRQHECYQVYAGLENAVPGLCVYGKHDAPEQTHEHGHGSGYHRNHVCKDSGFELKNRRFIGEMCFWKLFL